MKIANEIGQDNKPKKLVSEQDERGPRFWCVR